LNKKDDILRVFGAEINKSNGELKGGLIELASIKTGADLFGMGIKLTPTDDLNKLQFVVDERPKDKTFRNLHIYTLDNNLKNLGSTIVSIENDLDLFTLEDIVTTNANEYYLILKVFVENNTQNKRAAPLPKGYMLRKYDNRGRLAYEKQLTNTSENICFGGKLFKQINGKYIFCGFYGNNGDDQIKGVFSINIDEGGENLQVLSSMEINSKQNNIEEGDEVIEIDPKDSKNKVENPKRGGSGSFIKIRSIVQDKDLNSILLIAEQHKFIFYNKTINVNGVISKEGQSVSDIIYYNKELLLIHASSDGRIKNTKVISKWQNETRYLSQIIINSNYKAQYFGYFDNEASTARYSSIAAAKFGENVFVLYNDNPENAGLLNEVNPDVKGLKNFEKSSLYSMRINLLSFEIESKEVLKNSKEYVAMPRHAVLSGNQIYLPAMDFKSINQVIDNLGRLFLKE
jgi:hypothetical protein